MEKKSEKWIFVISVSCLLMAIILMVSVHLSLSHFKSEYDAGLKEGLSRCEVPKECPVCDARPIVQIAKKNTTDDGAILIDIAG